MNTQHDFSIMKTVLLTPDEIGLLLAVLPLPNQVNKNSEKEYRKLVKKLVDEL